MSHLVLTSVMKDEKSFTFPSFNRARKFARANGITVITQVVNNFLDHEKNFHPIVSRDYTI